MGDKDRANIKQDSFRKVDKGARNTVGATFNESALDSGGVSILNGILERLFEEPFERRGTYRTHIYDGLSGRTRYEVCVKQQ